MQKYSLLEDIHFKFSSFTKMNFEALPQYNLKYTKDPQHTLNILCVYRVELLRYKICIQLYLIDNLECSMSKNL